ncbi:MAG: tetratricopeptide repeat protein, partial [Planctomycetota bacterium]
RSHVGFGYQGITPLEYAATQPCVILNYLRLSFWSVGLCLDYDWPVARTAIVIIPPALVLLLLIGATAWGLVRRSWLGFAGAWFFVILAPTSSFIPIKDLAFEHRMYLPLAAVIAVVVFGGKALLDDFFGRLSTSQNVVRWIRGAATVVVTLLLTYGIYQRNKDYHSDLAIWADVAAKRPHNARARVAVGNALLARNRVEEAITAYRKAVAIRPDFADGQCALGMGLARKGALDEAVTAYSESLRLDPNLAKAHYNLGNALSRQGRIDESIRSFRESLRIQPRFADAHCNLGNALAAQGQLDESVTEYREAIRIKPGLANAYKGLGDALVQLGR